MVLGALEAAGLWGEFCPPLEVMETRRALLGLLLTAHPHGRGLVMLVAWAWPTSSSGFQPMSWHSWPSDQQGGLPLAFLNMQVVPSGMGPCHVWGGMRQERAVGALDGEGTEPAGDTQGPGEG